MKLKKFGEILSEREVFEGIDDPINFHELDIDDKDFDDDDDDDDDDKVIDQDALDSLCSTLRKMVRNSGFSVDSSWVFTDDENCINVQFMFNKSEKMNNLMNAMNFLKKLETDILIQYDSEFDLWETKSGSPLLTAKFFYDEGIDKKNVTDEELFDDSTSPF